MTEDNTSTTENRDRELTRRQWLAGGTTLVSGSLLAGCLGGGDETGTPTRSDDGTEADTPTETEATTETTTEPAETQANESYSVSLAPMGEVTFESVPADIFTIMSEYAEMALSLGRGANVNAVYAVEYTNSLMGTFTAPLEGVDVDWSDCYAAWNPGKEQLYDLDSDVHLADPANVVTMGNWEQADVEEIDRQVAPWFGNTLSATHAQPPEAYADSYEYYTLWETFDAVASVLQERDRYAALRAEYDALRERIDEGLPPADDRPSVGMVLPSTNDDTMWLYNLNVPGYHAAHTRPLGAEDAFADQSSGTSIDYETLLEADPDVLLILSGMVDSYDMPAIRETLADDPVASSVTAVQDDRVHPLGTRHQGPLLNLFQLEMGAKHLYPEAFGEWPHYESGPYPELAADEQLFDHAAVAATIRGDDQG